jgi:hypothetical protein
MDNAGWVYNLTYGSFFDTNKAREIMKQVLRQMVKLTRYGFTVSVILCIVPALLSAQENKGPEYNRYLPSSVCQACHTNIFDQHAQSQHAKAFTDPVFQGQYFKELLPQAEKDPKLLQEAKACIGCHSPIDFMKHNESAILKDEVNPGLSGVTCDFCHTIAGYDGEMPGNGNYISEPSAERKLGPFIHEYNWHHVYSQLQTKSEFCAICHNATNRYGLEIKSTFTEWKNSRFAEEHIQCQDCHMNSLGFLVAGKPIYESGWAAYMPLGRGVPYRSLLYTHRFPGAHSRTQIFGTGSLTLTIETEKSVVSPGDKIIVHILVDNSRTGHKMPSGSADLRQLWLELSAFNGDKIIFIPGRPTMGTSGYDVAGKGPFDREILSEDIPKGSRIYRAVFVDGKGRQTLSSYNAASIVFDNRLNASEIRRETYEFIIPKNFKNKITLRASLNYLPYPSSFSDRFGLPKPELFEVATIRKEIDLK